MSNREHEGAPGRTGRTARIGRLVRRSVRLHESLTETTNTFFAARPFKMVAHASATEPGRDHYSFKMDRSIPWKIRWQARRLLKVLRRLAKALPERPADGALEKLRRYQPPLVRPTLVPGARATTELQMDGRMLTGATISAPIWSPSTTEVSVVGQDPDGGLRGRVEVRYQLELSGGDDSLQRQSLLALTGAAIWEAQQMMQRTQTAQQRPAPMQAGRHEDRDGDEKHLGQ